MLPPHEAKQYNLSHLYKFGCPVLRETSFSEIKMLLEVGAVTGVTLRGQQGKFLILFHVGVEDMLLVAKRGNPRMFRDLTRAIQLLYELGIRKAALDLTHYGIGDLDERTGSNTSSEATRQDKKIDLDPDTEPTD